MFKLYGREPRCLWCGKANKENYKEIVMAIKYARPPQEKTIVCSEECEKKVLKTCRFIEKNIPIFWIGLITGFVLEVVSIFVRGFLRFSIMGVLILGITFIIFPFVTPQTVKIFGLRKGLILGRINGIILLLLGLFLLLKIA